MEYSNEPSDARWQNKTVAQVAHWFSAPVGLLDAPTLPGPRYTGHSEHEGRPCSVDITYGQQGYEILVRTMRDAPEGARIYPVADLGDLLSDFILATQDAGESEPAASTAAIPAEIVLDENTLEGRTLAFGGCRAYSVHRAPITIMCVAREGIPVPVLTTLTA
ncbi:hypothetical protein OG747_39025 [Streptomyces sp. NBC_01384]|uniref:hypothetical protein n=1 Tax=Streptomyces sp. NBC_01384 TaxID=2903847 RepID=UPI00324F52C9